MKKQKNKIGIRAAVLSVLILLVVCFIFSMSLPGVETSSAQSGTVMKLLEPILKPIVGEAHYTDRFVRKLAHFCEYSALGILLASLGWTVKKGIPYFLLVGFLIPFSDETIQLFTGRGAQIADVWLDISGVAFGSILVSLAALTVIFIRKSARIPKKSVTL